MIKNSSVTAVEWVGQFPRFKGGHDGYKPGLERMEAMLERLGNPHLSLPFIHVAGTNGKGSTCAFLTSIFESSGLSVGLYTSPYLETFHDRMRIDGKCVSDQQLNAYMERLKPIVEEISNSSVGVPTEFELVTALSILFFAEEKPDLVIWETGLGGRLDATNVVMPLLSVITNIGLDHQHILGATEREIAREKAGIIKRNTPVVTGANGEALQVILDTADSLSAPIFVLGRNFRAEVTSQSLNQMHMRYDSEHFHFGELRLALLGAHQVSNAALAICAAEILSDLKPDWNMTSTQIRTGIANARWPGRFEILAREPLLILDGAHNPHGVQALTNTVKSLLPETVKTIVVGILQDKVTPEILFPLAEIADRIIVTQPKTPRAAKAEELEQILAETGVPIQTVADVPTAVKYALDTSGSLEAVLVTGSLYTISEARTWWKRWIIKDGESG